MYVTRAIDGIAATHSNPSHRGDGPEKGFGMRAIERLLAQEIDGKAIVAFAPEGLRCSIEAPFTEKLGAETKAGVVNLS
jgi:two-component sensor histidine kinase